MKRLLLVLLLVACSAEKPAPPPAAAKPSTPPPPAPAAAQTLLASAPEFSEYEFTNAATTIPMQRSAMNEPALETAKQLQKAGWIAFDGSGTVVLTAKAKTDKRFLVRPNGFLDVVPLAKKELGEVTAVRANADGTAEVDFGWKWIPNEVGAAFTSGPLHDRYAAAQSATATLIWDGSNWSVLKIQ